MEKRWTPTPITRMSSSSVNCYCGINANLYSNKGHFYSWLLSVSYKGNLQLQSQPNGLRRVSQDYEPLKITSQIGGFEDVQAQFQATQLQSRFLIDFQGKSAVGINNNNIMETNQQMSPLTSGAYKTVHRIPLPLSFLLHVIKPKSHKIHNSHSEPVDSLQETWDTWGYQTFFFNIILPPVTHTWVVICASHLSI